MQTVVYRIGKANIVIHMPEDMTRPERLTLFEEDGRNPEVFEQVSYVLEFTDNVKDKADELQMRKKGNFQMVRSDLNCFQTDQGECRLIHFYGMGRPYAVTLQENQDRFHVWIDVSVRDMLVYDTVFIALLSLEKVMIRQNAMILHCAYMCYAQTAVLFSAPSETGKSTQAGLWEQYRHTRTINGDRALIYKEADGWYAHGWPVCGSSEICCNESYPIRAIVMLKQAKENQVYRLQGVQAFRHIMEQITINTWDMDFQMKVMDNLEELLQNIPVYMLECDISEAAVSCLEQILTADI